MTNLEALLGRELFVDVVEFDGEFGALRWSENYESVQFEKAKPNTLEAAKGIAAGFEHDYGDVPTTWVGDQLNFHSIG